MSSTREQALEGAKTNLRKNPNYYHEIGVLGGSTKTENTKRRGFGSMSKERRLELARKGGSRGKISHEKPKQKG